AHSLKGNKDWPIGILEAADYPCIALCEGIPDFLAAHDFVLKEQALEKDKNQIQCAPVGMMGSAPFISEEALAQFKNKIVRIFFHPDKAGIRAVTNWKTQIANAGAKRVDLFDMSPLQPFSK